MINKKIILIIGNDVRIFNPKLFTVATVQSLWSKIKRNDEELSKLFKTIDVLCIDEAHHINVAGKNKIQNTYFQHINLMSLFNRVFFNSQRLWHQHVFYLGWFVPFY